MKTLKRTLCLVLALVLALGTMGVASAVTYDDYTDADEINPRYAEAVEVTTALGIIDGMTDTAFVPDGNLTRAQAAKIVAYLMFGDAASILAVQSETKFTDVPKDFWASGYIAALTDAGVIAGMTDTTFEPNAPLTGYQWAKMCLCAMGYSGYVEDRYDEIFEGEFWAANVAKYALHAGLLDAMESTYFLGDVIKRDEAVQMGFYAMLNDYHEGRVVTIVPDGNGGWRLEIVVTPIVTLALENYGLVVEEGIVWKDDDTGTYWLVGYGDNEFNPVIDIRLTEDVAAYEGRHAYVWGTADDMRDLTVATQLTDVNLLDAYTELTAEDVAAYAEMDEDEQAAWIEENFDEFVYCYTNNKLDSTTRDAFKASLDALNGRIPANWKITLYNYDVTFDSDYDDVLVDEWVISTANYNEADKNYDFDALNPADNWYDVADVTGTYVDGAYYTVYKNYGYGNVDFFYYEDLPTDYNHAYWALAADYGKFLAAPAALKTVTTTVNDLEVKNPDIYDAPYLTFETDDGDMNESIFYQGSIYDSAWYNGDLDYPVEDFLGFNYTFYLDPNGEVVAYVIAEQTEYVAYVSDYYYVLGETTQSGHHDSITGWTVYAHGVDLDGNIISIPVDSSAEGGATAAKAVVNTLNGNLTKSNMRVKYYHLLNTGLYEGDYDTEGNSAKYKYAAYVNITDIEKFTNAKDNDFNFVDSTNVFNVSETNGVIDVAEIDVALSKAWIVWNPNQDADETDFTVTNIFYDNYKPVVTTNLYIAAGTEIDHSNVAGTIHYFYVYLDGVKTMVASNQKLNVLATALTNGGFYSFTVDGSLYTIGDKLDCHDETITQTYAQKNLISIDGNNTVDIDITGKTFIDLTTNEVGIQRGSKLCSLNGVAKDNVIYIVDWEDLD